jgi:hypothetical protein
MKKPRAAMPGVFLFWRAARRNSHPVISFRRPAKAGTRLDLRESEQKELQPASAGMTK